MNIARIIQLLFNKKDRVRLAGAKLNLDGSPQGKTAWLKEPYYVPPKGEDANYVGYGTFENKDDELLELVKFVLENKIQIQSHCNGDRACEQFIKAVEEVSKQVEDYHIHNHRYRPVMIHAQTVTDNQLDKMKDLGMFPAFFPSHTFYWGDWHRDSVLGPQRAERISPTRSAMNRGMIFSSHNDAPVVLPSAMHLMWSVVNRRTRSNDILGATQCATPLEALKSITLWQAYQHFEKHHKGSIEKHKLADFAILSDNPLTVDPN